jgi:hypothetical protein
MSKAPKSTLSKKAQRAAAPADVKPYLLTKKYADPATCNKTDVKRIIGKDIQNLQDMIQRIGRPEDMEQLGAAQQLFGSWNPDDDLHIDVCVDSHTGVRYVVDVVKR